MYSWYGSWFDGARKEIAWHVQFISWTDLIWNEMVEIFCLNIVEQTFYMQYIPHCKIIVNPGDVSY